MPKKPTFKLPPLNLGDETLGQRIARLRKANGYTQTDLAQELSQGESAQKEISNIRVLISDYERNKIRPNYEMIVRLALVLGVTADELLGIKQAEVSHLLNGHFSRFSTDKLLDFLKKMEQKVTIQISPHKQGEPYQQVRFGM